MEPVDALNVHRDPSGDVAVSASSACATVEAADPERRYTYDRRRQKTPLFSRYTLFGGRRTGGRRGEESRNVYVDRYDMGVVTLFLAILLLNVLDAYFTLVFIQVGGKEANPIAQWFLDLGTLPFILVKSAAIGMFLLVLVIHKTFLSVPKLLMVILGFYGLLLVYHIALQIVIIPQLQ